ncbi:MAG: acyl-CoA dehydrogenase [Betaproteobacteria bacterium]|nr:acyl-CoA dehydrogenase [Betaproteobacteria bacterium]
MDHLLTDTQRAWQQKAREFADAEIRPRSLARDQIAEPAGTFDWALMRKGSQLGIRTAAVPVEYGGHGIDFTTQALMITEMAKADSAMAKTFSQSWKWSHLIVDQGNAEQKRRFFDAFVKDDQFVMGGGITEPNAGSDNRLPPGDDPKAGLQLKAQLDGDTWVLNGSKCYIANANIGKLIFAFARTDPNAPVHEGTTIFAVEPGTPGLKVGKVFNKHGWRFYQNAELFFENVRVADSNRLGAINGAHKKHGGKNSRFGEMEYSANALGICDAAIEMAAAHGRAHRQAGKRLNEHQLFQLKLSEMHMLTEALRSFVMRVAMEADVTAPISRKHNGFLMNFSTDAMQRVCYLNLDIHRAANKGEISAQAEKLVRDAIIWTHIAGDSVTRLKAVKALL